ncbi:MAG: Type 4 prepilin-like proteins leader peptide-processing enzyme [Parcubacteria group bacterium ADurb.Bin247]|nr:MAG: Type 4 prepilin-like proteins leader peptide-processing enzyme [Parcubacteria group bacterium ADurb.Bin247]
MGLFLGFPNILTALFLSFVIGSVVGIIAILLKKKKVKSEIPFAPFLITGTVLSFFYGSNILNWYFDLININAIF